MRDDSSMEVDDPRVQAAYAAWRERVAAGEPLDAEAFLTGQPVALHAGLRQLDAEREDELPAPEASPEELAAEDALKRFLAAERAGAPASFERFREEQPEALRELLTVKYEALQRFRSELPSLDWADLLPDDELDGERALGSTRQFGQAFQDADEDPVDGTRDILDRLTYTRGARGRYVSDGRVGRGGEGEIRRVWDRLMRRVLAMKVMHRSDDPEERKAFERLRRFHDEALVTAELDHPGILPIHDLGVDGEGQVFYTMKYVRGHEDLRRVFEKIVDGDTSWTVNRAVGAILRVCEAVAYAHSKGILHRDIKPANVLVGEYGETYLADWGLARRMDDPEPLEAGEERRAFGELPGGDEAPDDTWLLTRDGNVIGTPPYMSPEQARGDLALDERSDIYALGALLYQLLTGRVPYVEPDDVPEPLLILVKVMKGRLTPVLELAPEAPPGLVAVCERAMARDPEDRYQGASEMAAALEDYLADLSADREEARRQARRAETINAFLLRMLSSGDPSRALGEEVTVRQVIERAADQLGKGLEEAPFETAILRKTIGVLQRELGQYDAAQVQLTRAATELTGLLGGEHRETLLALYEVAYVLRLQGRHDLSEARMREVLEIQTRVLGAGHADTLDSLISLAEGIRIGRDRLPEVEALMRRALAARRDSDGRHSRHTLMVQNRLANVLVDQGGSERLAEAEGLLRESAELLARHFSDRDPACLTARNDLGRVLLNRRDLAGAERTWRRVLPMQRLVLGDEHPDVITTRANLGWALARQGQLDEGQAQLEAALDAQRRTMGVNNPTARVFLNNLALVHRDRGDLRAALELLQELVDGWEGEGGDDVNWHRARARHNLGTVLAALGRPDEARAQFEAARDVLLPVLGADHRFSREVLAELAGLGESEAG